MKLLNAKYVRYVNMRYKRIGTLWQVRFKSCLVEDKDYFSVCLRYIESNPIRAGIAKLPESYRWSSYRFRAFGEKCHILDPDRWYNELASEGAERQLIYRNLFQLADQGT